MPVVNIFYFKVVLLVAGREGEREEERSVKRKGQRKEIFGPIISLDVISCFQK